MINTLKDIPENERHSFHVQIQNSIDKVDRKSTVYKWAYYSLRIILILLAGAITFISGWSGDKTSHVFDMLLGLGVLTTMVTALDALFQIETKKNVYKLMLVELRELRTEFEHTYRNKSENLNETVKQIFFPKFKNIMASVKIFIDHEKEEK